jgi:K+-sensing histidine kinase KdpD
MHDVSHQRQLEKAEEQNHLLNLLTSSVSHELLIPIKCIANFSTNILEDNSDENVLSKAHLIFNTA